MKIKATTGIAVQNDVLETENCEGFLISNSARVLKNNYKRAARNVCSHVTLIPEKRDHGLYSPTILSTFLL